MPRVVHFEIHASDQDKLEKFYKDVFGWEFQHMGADMGDYRVIVTGPGMDKLDELPKNPGINGGMTPRKGPMPKSGDAVNAYVCIIGVDNIDLYIDKAKKAGGTVALEKMEVPGVGFLAYFKDPENNIFGILQPTPHSMPLQA